jgi:hypothetical protein
MDSDISEEELDTFLKEAGIFTEPTDPAPPIEKEESLGRLIEEIIASTQDPPPAEKFDEPPPFLAEKENPPFSLLPLLLCITFLGGVFLGALFGLYWGSTQRVDPTPPTYEEIDAKITRLADQIQEIYNAIASPIPPEEVIEPLEPVEEMKKLAPEKVM